MKKLLTLMVAAFFGCPLFATTWYVNGTSGLDSHSGTSSSQAKKTIQAAIDSAADGDTIRVTTGVYAPIDTKDKSLTICSQDGADKTIIDGVESQRCAGLGGRTWAEEEGDEREMFSTLVGFTLRNGADGAYWSASEGAAVRGGMIKGCIITGCNALGAVVYACEAHDCLVRKNDASSAMAVMMHGRAYNCTIVDNEGDAAWDNGLVNSALFENSGDVYISSGNGCAYPTNCVLQSSLSFGFGNKVGDPKFVDVANGDYHLAVGSPCIDAGDNSYVTSETDLDGNARIVNGKVDIGCYEYSEKTTWYVNGTSGSDSYSGASSAKAKKTIQAAIDVAVDGDTILVAPGTYAPITTHSKQIEIRGVGTRESTVIDGGNVARCAVLADSWADQECEDYRNRLNTRLIGFSLVNGRDSDTANGDGAAVCGGTVCDCVIRECMAVRSVAFAGVQRNCLFIKNDASSGYAILMHGAASDGGAANCTIVGNKGRVAWDNGMKNTIAIGGGVFCNSWNQEGYCYNCVVDSVCDGSNNIITDPKFVDAVNGDYHLASNSPCVDAGDNSYVTSAMDLDGSARIVNGKVDIGCYEYQGGTVVTKCAVTFEAAGGTAEWTKGEVAKDAAVDTLPTATREGYEFLGWFTAAVGGTQVTAATVVTEDVTFYAQWKRSGETPLPQYGPWGEAESVKNPDKLGPTMLTDMTLELNGAAGAVGDVVAAFRGDTEALCGLGKVMDESGTLSMVCYAPTGVKLHFKVWVAASGVENPAVVDCDAKSDLTAPTSGAFLSGHALVVSDDKDLTITLGSADWHTVSFNVLPEDPSPAAMFGSVKAKVAAVTQGIEFWMPGKSSSLKAIEIGKGYWVNTKVDDVEWTVSGKTDPKAEIALEEGWNLVGYTPEAEGAVQAVLKTAIAAKAVDYVTYGVEFYPGGTLKKMEPGKAYWVHAKKAYTLVYDEVGAVLKVAAVYGDRNVAAPLLGAAVPTYGPWGESAAVKNPDKLGPTFLTDMAVEIDGEPAAYGDVVAVFRGDTGALCGLGKVMDDSGTLTVVCYAPKGVTLSFKVWLAESGMDEPVIVKCDNASKLIAPESGAFYDGHAISGSTAEFMETVILGEKVRIETGLVGYTASGLPKGLSYSKTTGLISGAAKAATAAEGVVVKFTKKGAEVEELTIVVRAEEISVGCEGLSSGSLPAGVVGAAGGMDIQVDSEGGTKSVSVTKLPSGMKYDKKSGKITGAPTKAGDYEVVLTVTTAYGNKETVKIPVSVTAMPVMAVGMFSGFVSVGEDNLGTFTLTTTDAGKLTAKVVTAAGSVSFSGPCWDAVESGVYRVKLKTKKGEELSLRLDSTVAWNANQLAGSCSAAGGRVLDVAAQRNAFGKTWYFAATGDERMGWTLAYAENAKAAALTLTLKADGSVSIAGTLQGTKDAKGKAATFKVSASGYANVGGLGDGALIADFAPVLTVNKVKTVLAIMTNLWFDRSNDHAQGVGAAKFVK